MKLEIDYGSHPAFAGISVGNPRSPDAQRYFAAVDEIWRGLVSPSEHLTVEQAGQTFDLEVRPRLGELKQALNQLHIVAEYRPFVFKALDDSYQAVRAEILQVISGRAYRVVRNAQVESICKQLREKGAAAVRVDRESRSRIFESLRPFAKEVDAQRNAGTGARCFVEVPARGTHWELLKAFVRRNHIEDAISAYAGFPLTLMGYALTLSHPGETWFKICYNDIGLSATRTVQMHFDLDNLSAKSMFYLNDVDVEDGPFCYIPNSGEFIVSRSQTSFFKYLDYANNDYAISRGVAETIYNRPMFITASLRPAFASLPVELQGSACPGDDVLDGTLLSRELLESERPLTTLDGDLMLFAGGETLHRGGVATAGQRYALQMIYKQPPSFTQKLISLPRALGSRAKQMVLGT